MLKQKSNSKNLMLAIRFFAIISLAAVLLADSFYWFSEDIAYLTVILMSVYILVWSYEQHFGKSKILITWLSIALAILLAIGIIFFYLQSL